MRVQVRLNIDGRLFELDNQLRLRSDVERHDMRVRAGLREERH